MLNERTFRPLVNCDAKPQCIAWSGRNPVHGATNLHEPANCRGAWQCARLCTRRIGTGRITKGRIAMRPYISTPCLHHGSGALCFVPGARQSATGTMRSRSQAANAARSIVPEATCRMTASCSSTPADNSKPLCSRKYSMQACPVRCCRPQKDGFESANSPAQPLCRAAWDTNRRRTRSCAADQRRSAPRHRCECPLNHRKLQSPGDEHRAHPHS